MQNTPATQTKTHHYCSSGWTIKGDGTPVHTGECLNDGNLKCWTETLTAISKRRYTSKGQELVTWQGTYRSQTWEPLGSTVVAK